MGADSEDGMAKADFQLEKDMTERVERWLHRGHSAVRREFETQWGICDLVAVAFDQEKQRQRLTEVSEASVGPLSRLALLTLARELKSVGQKSLERHCREMFGIEDVTEHLERLAALGLIEIERRRVTARRVSWFPTHTQIVAVELKLGRVEEAFYQAFNNLRFAHRSYVALPWNVARRAAESEWSKRFEEAGVGLLAVAESKCQVVLEGRTSRSLLDRTLQDHSAERLWRWKLKGSASSTVGQSARAALRVR